MRKFYDSVDLRKLDQLDAVLLRAKGQWQQGHKYDRTFEDTEPILMLTLGDLLLDDVNSDEAELQLARHNVVEKARSWAGKRLTHWTFKEYCKFWREFIDDTIAYGLYIAQVFHDFYSRESMEAKWLELDVCNKSQCTPVCKSRSFPKTTMFACR